MSRFYGQVEGMSTTVAGRRGNKYIKSSVQSHDGSIIMRLDEFNGETKLTVYHDDETSFYGNRIFYGSIAEFVDLLENYKK